METCSLQCKDTNLTSYRKVIYSPIENCINLKAWSVDFKACGLLKASNEKVRVK